ncbi:NAD-dependent epimerase/dehydratase family protein, partial [Pseudomonas aeruginosa]|nr:NAD-dependent epimerase/dehydratase family protein [Pseudomonas aeruginosa]
MHILLTGGTGLMGRRLCARWRQAGHRLTVFSRRPQQVESLCGVAVLVETIDAAHADA